MTSFNELKISLFLVWSILSVMILLTLVAPLLLDQDSILKLAPECVSRTKYNEECSLCGMTRAFVAISEGNFGVAYSVNNSSLPVYLTFTLNEIFFFGFILGKVYQRALNQREKWSRVFQS